MAVTMRKMYDTKTFSEIYESVNDFVYDFNNIGITKMISVENAMTLYYLLYARHGNDPIANYDENQFKFKLFTLIWQYGAEWQKKLEIQANIRALTEADIREGGESISNHASNPNTSPETNAYEALTYIDSQNAMKGKISKIDAYLKQWNLLDSNLTEDFLIRFNILFKKFVKPGTFIYVSEEDEDDEA